MVRKLHLSVSDNRPIAEYNRAAQFDQVKLTETEHACKCITCKHTAKDVLSVPIIIKERVENVQYIHAECWDRIMDPSVIADVTTGRPNKKLTSYRVTLTVHSGITGEQHGSLIVSRNQPAWIYTGVKTYTSPLYLSNKGMWQRLDTLAHYFDSATVRIEAWGYERTEEIPEPHDFFFVDEFETDWDNNDRRDEAGKFVNQYDARREKIREWIEYAQGVRKEIIH